jgi:ornithine carbamoyltransferase
LTVASETVPGVPSDLKGRSFTTLASWSRDELATLLDLADELKTERARRRELLPGRTIGLIFHKPSTRTRVAFGSRPRTGCTPRRPSWRS